MEQSLKIDDSSQVIFDKEFFMTMLELEKKFYEKHINVEQIGKLVAMNARCIEYYNSKKDNSKYYYMNKIQYILSRKESLEQIIKEGKTTSCLQQSSDDNGIILPKEYEINLNYSEPTSEQREFKINNIRCSFTNKNDLSESDNRRKLQGEHQMNIHQYEQNQDDQVKHMVEESEIKQLKNDEIIKKELQNQDDKLKQRIAKKKAHKSQKQTNFKRANSFDDSEVNQNERVSDNSNCDQQRNNNQNIEETHDGDENKNMNQSKVITDNNQICDTNEKNKEKEINYLKQSFNQSYKQLFDSINQRYNNRQKSKRLSTFDLENIDGDTKFTLTNSQVLEDKPNQLTRGSSGSHKVSQETNLLDNLEGLLSAHGGETNLLGNPYEEYDIEKEINNDKNKKSVRFDENLNKHMS